MFLEPNGYKLSYTIFALTLAIIPFAISLYLYKTSRKKKIASIIFWPLFITWFFFYPNIPYLFTKGRYLLGYCDSASAWDLCGHTWMIGFFFLHAMVGAPLLYLSTRHMSTVLSKRYMRISHRTLAGIMLPLSAIAFPIGLYGRLNSWNLITDLGLVESILYGYIVTIGVGDILAWTIILYCIYAVMDGAQYLLRSDKE